MKRRALEQPVHAAIVDYLALNESPAIWTYWHANNGGRLSIRQAAAAKARGVRAGVPDLCLSVRGQIVWAEIKRPRGPRGGESNSRLSPAQVEWIGFASMRGERTFTLRSVADAEAMLVTLGIEVRARVAA